ncbi:hypothetical protein U8335_02785 [Roseiconus lacunae]|uniref:hypothetical protein n=1 Tax=Roseiconus lacunae TaxID=2605694 RepID=UPI003090291F|nr:hypothetical protein U8335_02785 [Stieleria sp. HD01]
MSSIGKMSRRVFSGAVAGALAMVASVAMADAPAEPQTADSEFFSAMDAGKIEVKFIPVNASKANVLVRNLTDQPMTLQMPAAFAGVPINRQMGMGGMGGMGGGMGGMGGGMGGMGGMMRVAPNRQQKLAVTTVCLEHGKPDPTPKMAYKIVPLDLVTTDQRVHVLCEALGNRQVAQNTAQAAAWNLMDKMSWEELAAKNRVESKYTGNIRWFSPIEIRSAIAVVGEATRIADARSPSSETESLSDDSHVEESLSEDS